MTVAPGRLAFELLLIVDTSPHHQTQLRTALQAPGVSSAAVLLRDKQASSRQLLDCAFALRALTRDRAAHLLISDRLDVALLSQADGVHLPEAGFSVAQARALLGSALIIGASRHDGAGVAQAEREGASYATLSPVFVSPGKGAPIGLEAFARVARSCRLPLFALGGVRTQDVPALAAAGAAGAAVIRDVIEAPEPAIAAAELLLALRSHLPHRSLAPQGDAG